MQRGIQRGLGQIERLAASSPKSLSNRVSVRGPGFDRGQQQQIQMALQCFGIHTS
jgi:hypothetical protein